MKYPIVKPYLPSTNQYQQSVTDIFERNWLTNNGPLLQKLEQKLADYLQVEHLLLVANGTLALQVAYAALNVTGRVLTTPFSFAATTSSLMWQGLTPSFIDINPQSLNIDSTAISSEEAKAASTILAVHVFGNPCDVTKIDELAKAHQLKVIYDAAHAFASNVNGKSVLSYGDASTLSLHATKLFHSVEGGAIIFKNKADYQKAKQLINFGFNAEYYPQYIGINAKMSEFHAAMGLAVLDDIEHITKQRKLLVARYHQNLANIAQLQLQQWHDCNESYEGNDERNGAYMPIVLKNEALLLQVVANLKAVGIQTRRYFYPSLAQVDVYLKQGNTPIGDDIAKRILCLPMYTDLTVADVDFICEQLIKILAV